METLNLTDFDTAESLLAEGIRRAAAVVDYNHPYFVACGPVFVYVADGVPHYIGDGDEGEEITAEDAIELIWKRYQPAIADRLRGLSG
jgi:hypothetical protein